MRALARHICVIRSEKREGVIFPMSRVLFGLWSRGEQRVATCGSKRMLEGGDTA